MTQYKYAGAGEFYQGLPMIDLDDADLTDEQIALLVIASQRGYYKTASDLLDAGSVHSIDALMDAQQKVEYVNEDTANGPTDNQPAADA